MLAAQVTDGKKRERVLQISGFVKPSGAKAAKVVNDENEAYFVLISSNDETACRHANNNEECKGHKYTGHCYHVDAVKVASLPSFEEVTAQPVVETLEQITAGINHYKSVIAAWDAACEEPTAANNSAAVAIAPRELQIFYGSGEYWPKYRDESGEWQHFKDDRSGWYVHFAGGCRDDAYRFIAIDSDEHRTAVLAEIWRRAEEQWAAYEAHKASAQPVIESSETASKRRMSSTLGNNQGFSLLKKAVV